MADWQPSTFVADEPDAPASTWQPSTFVADEPDVQKDITPTDVRQDMLATSKNAQYKDPAAAVTGYGAALVNQVPYLHELGSAEAAALGAGAGDTWSDRYKNLEQSQQAMREASEDIHPYVTRGAEAITALGIGTALPLPGMQGLSRLQRVGRMAAAGAGYGALSGSDNADAFASDDEQHNQRLWGAGRGAVEGAVLGPLVNELLPATRNADRLAGEAKPTMDQLREVSGHTFEMADEVGDALHTGQMESFVNHIQNVAQQPSEVEALFGKSPISDLAKNSETLRGKPLTFEGATGIDQKLGDLIRKEVDPETGLLTAEGQKLTSILDHLRDMMEQPIAGKGFELQNQAKALWAQQARMREIQGIIDRAANTQQPTTALQTGFRQLLGNGKRMRGYDAGDRAMIQRFAKNPGAAGELLRLYSGRLLATGAAAHNPLAGAAANLGSTAARSLRDRVALGRAKQLVDRLRNRNPLPDLSGYQPVEGRFHSSGALEAPAMRVPPGGFAAGEMQGPPRGPGPQLRLPRGGSDPYYMPQGRMLTYERPSDFTVSPEGVAEPTQTTKIRQRPDLSSSFEDTKVATKKNSGRGTQKLLTYRPRPDFIATDNGIVQKRNDIVRDSSFLGGAEDLPIGIDGELEAIKKNPKWPKEKRGGRIISTHSGKVTPNRLSYPALARKKP